MQVKRSEESFTTVFRHWAQNSPSDFQLEKPGFKDIGGFDPCVQPCCCEYMAARGHF